MKLSIVIPVYNVEKYVSECLDSCLEQNVDITDYEIIIVNDGSTDNSANLINLYAKQSNIIIINQENLGLSAARNAGMKIAKGEYIWFVDSDDWIEPGILKRILLAISLCAKDCFRLNYRTVTEAGKILKDYTPLKKGDESCQTGMEFLSKDFSFSFYAWSFVFNRYFLGKNNFFFTEGLIFEDLQLIPRVLRKAKCVKELPFIAYNYRQRKDSLVNSVNEKMLDSVFYILKSYQNYIPSISNDKEKKYFILLSNRIKIMFLVLLGNFENSIKKRRYLLDFKREYPSIKILIGMSLKEKICAIIYNFSLQLLCGLFDIKYLLK